MRIHKRRITIEHQQARKPQLPRRPDPLARSGKLGKRRLIVEVATPLDRVPGALAAYAIELDDRRQTLTLTFDAATRAPIGLLATELGKTGSEIVDVRTSESSLEDIFVTLVKGAA